MEKAARKAGQRLRRDFGEVEHLQVSRKGPADFVSKADQASERSLYDELLIARPDGGCVLEEGGVPDPAHVARQARVHHRHQAGHVPGLPQRAARLEPARDQLVVVLVRDRRRFPRVVPYG